MRILAGYRDERERERVGWRDREEDRLGTQFREINKYLPSPYENACGGTLE